MRRILLMVVLLLPAGCSSLDSIPLSDVPIPEAAPRLAAGPRAPIPRLAAEPPAPMPPARPQPPSASAIIPSVETAGAVGAPLFEEPARRAKPEVKNAGEVIVSAVDTLLSPMPAMAFADEAQGSALTGDGALYRSGLVERREVVGGDGTLEPANKRQPAEVSVVAPASVNAATISRIEIPSFSARTWIWVMIGFAALIGLFLSARQTAD